jgi:hypothetical protein
MVSRSSLDGRFTSTVSETERYFASIDISPGPGFCNPWTGGTFSNGRPRFNLSAPSRTSVIAARYGWQLLRGPIPPKLMVCHFCDWGPCMNPMHWYLGTNAMNLADMVARGRSLYGSKSPKAKLTEADARVIRYELLPLVATGRDWARRGGGQLTMGEIASRYGVTVPTINCIRLGRTWKHV